MSQEVKRRVRALKRIILALRFKTEVHLFKLKYQKVYEPYINKQTYIIQKNHEPTKSEYSSSEEEDEQVPRYHELGEVGLEQCKQEPKGIPDFWLVYMKDSYKFSSNILSHDEPIIRLFSDIRCNLSEEYIGFTMDFHFTPNEWFTNNVLTLKFVEDPSDNIYDIEIKNETLKGTEVSFNKTVENPSFFNLFNDKFNFTNPDRLCFQKFFKKYKQQCNWLVHEAFISFYLHQSGVFGLAEMFNFSEDYETNESYIETDVEDNKSICAFCRGSFAFGLSGGMVVGGCAWVVGESLGQIRTKDVMPLLRQAEKGCYRVNGEDCKAILWLPPLPQWCVDKRA
ncbi:hypothetical protein QTP88_005766 [Uroleucon formosanum]